MAYGKGKNKEMQKRMADLGTIEMTPDFARLRSTVFDTIGRMTDAVWPSDVFNAVTPLKDLDTVMLAVQSQTSKDGLNSVWGEKARLIAKPAVLEQWKRAQKNAFGKLKNIATVGETPLEDGTRRLVNLPEEVARLLSDHDVTEMQDFADGLSFTQAMQMFRDLRVGEVGLPTCQAEALRALAVTVRERWKRPVWKEDAVIQLHIDFRCVRGGRAVLTQQLASLSSALKGSDKAKVELPLTSVSPRGERLAVGLRIPNFVVQKYGAENDVGVAALVLQLGRSTSAVKIVITKPPCSPSVVGARTVVAEDFGFVNTSSIVVLRSATPIGVGAVERIAGHNGEDVAKVGKHQAKDFLSDHISGDDIEVLEALQFNGRPFLDRIKAQSSSIDRLRSEIDQIYKRLARIRREINTVAGSEPGAVVPEAAQLPDHPRYMAMHERFFRLLTAVKGLKDMRRGIYRAIAGLKTSWFGHVAQRKAALAEKYGAVIVTEDLDIVTIPKDEPTYKGRTFNKMINNGAKGQYNLRSQNILQWRGIASIKVPSYYTSSTDWRTGAVDKKQRRELVFKAASDGRVWDADLHAAETIGRYLFLRPKSVSQPLALAA
jgi:hypothetical protein